MTAAGQARAASGQVASKWNLQEVRRAVLAPWPEASEEGLSGRQGQQIFLLGPFSAGSEGLLSNSPSFIPSFI